MKKILALVLALVLVAVVVSAHGEETFAEAEELIKSKISCSELTDDQLEIRR
jgi:hypothetical protein